jgi:hypothetical protein
MAHDSIAEKQKAHELIERLAPSQMPVVLRLLTLMLDPVARAIVGAPIDVEPLTPEEERALDEAQKWAATFRSLPHEEVLAELGITPEEIDRYKEQK